jgi:hypothetical protein
MTGPDLSAAGIGAIVARAADYDSWEYVNKGDDMYDVRVQLAHLHGGQLVPMSRREHHGPADHDIERALARGAMVFRCDSCSDEVVVLPDEARPTVAAPGPGH